MSEVWIGIWIWSWLATYLIHICLNCLSNWITVRIIQTHYSSFLTIIVITELVIIITISWIRHRFRLFYYYCVVSVLIYYI